MMVDLLLPSSGSGSDLHRLDIKVEAFVTRESSPEEEPRMLITTLWFKPRTSDVPVAPVLGPNGWLGLAAVLASSFAIFLLLVGLVQHYYIYPIDHNTNKVYPSSARAVLNLLFMCTGVMATSSCAVLWNKSRSTMEATQIRKVDSLTPLVSSSSSFYDTEGDLERLSCESLVKATNVHYGGRPDIKKMLLACDGANVGVMASGPKGMRHDVANICASGLADNLHFESISFSW